MNTLSKFLFTISFLFSFNRTKKSSSENSQNILSVKLRSPAFIISSPSKLTKETLLLSYRPINGILSTTSKLFCPKNSDFNKLIQEITNKRNESSLKIFEKMLPEYKKE